MTAEQQAQEDAAAADAAAAVEANKPRPSALKFAQIKSKVEDFLWNLYSTLDEPHQAMEKVYRGDAAGLDTNVQRPLPDLFTGDRAVSSADAKGAFSPPFGSMNRSGLGDPIATAQQASSAADGLKKAFGDFGENLQKNTKKAELGQEITNLKGQIDRLSKRLADVQNTSGRVVVGNTDDAADLQRQLAGAQQQLAQKQAQMAQLG